MPGLVLRAGDDLLVDIVQGRLVMHAPAIARQRAGEPRDVRHALVARAEEVALGIGEVGIPAVDEVRRIADALQLCRDPREAT